MTASVDWGDEDEATAPKPADSWYDDAPITDEQIEAVRRDLDTPVAQRGAAFAPFVVRKLLAEIDRLNTVLDANPVVRNAAESSCRTLKGVIHLLKTERTQLRSELADARGAMEILRSSGKEQCARAETAERELAELRKLAGNPTYQWASSAPGFFFGPPLLDESHVRRLVSEINARGGQAVLKRRLVGEWTEVDGG